MGLTWKQRQKRHIRHMITWTVVTSVRFGHHVLHVNRDQLIQQLSIRSSFLFTDSPTQTEDNTVKKGRSKRTGCMSADTETGSSIHVTSECVCAEAGRCTSSGGMKMRENVQTPLKKSAKGSFQSPTVGTGRSVSCWYEAQHVQSQLKGRG